MSSCTMYFAMNKDCGVLTASFYGRIHPACSHWGLEQCSSLLTCPNDQIRELVAMHVNSGTSDCSSHNSIWASRRTCRRVLVAVSKLGYDEKDFTSMNESGTSSRLITKISVTHLWLARVDTFTFRRFVASTRVKNTLAMASISEWCSNLCCISWSPTMNESETVSMQSSSCGKIGSTSRGSPQWIFITSCHRIADGAGIGGAVISCNMIK